LHTLPPYVNPPGRAREFDDSVIDLSRALLTWHLKVRTLSHCTVALYLFRGGSLWRLGYWV